MVCYAILSDAMVWYGMESMVCYEISMLWYVVKDKHSATECRHQVFHQKENDRKKDRRTESGHAHVVHKKNLANPIRELDSLVTNREWFEKSIVRDQGKTSCLAQFNFIQGRTDIRLLCCSGQTVLRVTRRERKIVANNV